MARKPINTKVTIIIFWPACIKALRPNLSRSCPEMTVTMICRRLRKMRQVKLFLKKYEEELKFKLEIK